MISSEAYNTYILANLQPECYEAGKDITEVISDIISS